MSPRLALARAGGSATRSEPCVFCVAHQLRRPSQHHALRQGPSRPRTTSGRIAPTCFSESIQRRRFASSQGKPAALDEFENRNRIGLFTMFHSGGNLTLKPEIANKLVKEFMSRERVNPAMRVTQLAKEYKTDLSELTKIAHGLYLIRSKNDEVGRKRPTSFQRVAKELFLALSEAREPSATLHILRAAYLSPYQKGAKDVASNFSLIQVKAARQVLEELAAAKNPEAMTLLGVFWEKEGEKDQARAMYKEAMKLQKLSYDAEVDNRLLGFRQIAPWNALGLSLKAEGNPESKQQAIEVFKKGALEADDPESYYHLATLGEEGSGEWLQYMHKAAGSGHQDAIYTLGIFYLSADPHQVAATRDSKLMKMLKWVFDMGKSKTEVLGVEWLTEGAQVQHKPSMMALVSYLEKSKDPASQPKVREQVISMLEQLAAPPEGDKAEKWPELVSQARRRLQELKARQR